MVKDKKSDKPNIIRQFSRPPVVAVLGHVDHGKTTLLDTIRKTNLAQKEPGQITQKIGAYQVEIETKEGKKKITFIDTPGHEVFTKIRSRGAQVTDLALLVVSASDGVQPQTVESIKHIKKAGIPFIVVITKIDLPTADPKKVKHELAKQDVLVEELGGKIVSVAVSAKTGKGIKELLEMITLLGELSGVKGNSQGELEGTIIESSLNSQKGAIATAIIKNGTLKVGEEILVEGQPIKIRALLTDSGESLREASAGMPVLILGFSQVPPVGARIGDRKDKEQKEEAKEKEKPAVTTPMTMTPEGQGTLKLKIILKTDNISSQEAIMNSLSHNISVLSVAVGDITEEDVLLGKTTSAIIIGFNVKISKYASQLAKTEKVKIKTYQIIYELLEELSEVAEGLGEKGLEEILGQAKIIAQFPYEKKRIAGVKVLEGRIVRGDLVRIERDSEKLGEARIKSLKKFKEEINKALPQEECGVLLDSNIDFGIGDVLISILRR